MKEITSCLLILAIYFWPNLAYGEENPCIISTDAIKQASAIRGLPIKRETPCYLHDKEQVKNYLLGAIKSKIPEKRMHAEALVYKALGFIPRDYDYEKGLLKLYLDQLGGYYDPERDHFVMAAWMPAIMQIPVAVHELTHSLQDQHYELESFTDIKKYSSDQILARLALIEGDATAVMVDYTRKLVGQPAISEDKDVTSIMMQNIMGTSLFGGLRDVPESLKLTLLFPYTSGLRFVHALLKKGGYKEVDKAFKDPPHSTEQILHPEKYRANDSDFIVIPPPLSKNKETAKSKLIFDDTMGEFAIVSLFSMYEAHKPKVADIAAGWGGDRVAVYEIAAESAEKETEKDIKKNFEVIWHTHWDTERDAQEFFEAYKTLSAKLSGIEIEKTPKNVTLSWSGPFD